MASEDKESRATRGFIDAIPHNRALGLSVVSIERAHATFKLGYDAKLVGNYAIQFTWSDGHNTGIFDFRFLRSLSEG